MGHHAGVILLLVALAGVAVGVPLGAYGRWAGWGFGLGWWGTPTPVRVTEVRPLTGAAMRGGAEWAVTEAAHRVAVDVEVQPEGGEPYEATTITWQPSGQDLTGRTVVARVSRTRPRRVFVAKEAAAAPEGDGTY
jgi:hypothetical protein